MPQINLLAPTSNKEAAKKAKSVDLPWLNLLVAFRSALVSAIPLTLICGLISVGLFVVKDRKDSELKTIQQREASLTVNPQELSEWKKREVTLKKKISLLSELSSPGFSRSTKLLEINDYLPEGVWLSEIYLGKSGQSWETTAGARRQTVLIIKGSAVAPQIDNAVALVGEFVTSLKRSQSFSRDFSEIKLNAIYKSSIGRTDVMNFELVCYLRS
jgi:Tfp pilus assembly protein PilN